jgi:hypothetical protein
LGILAMGFIFDRFGTRSDAEQLQKLLMQKVRMLAQLVIRPVVRDKATYDSQFIRLRSQINDTFATLTSQMDTVQFEFEFRHRREEELAEWERIERAQPALRSIYLLELTLYRRRREIDDKLTPDQNHALGQFLNEYSDQLMHVAAWIAHEEDAPARLSDNSIRLLQEAFESHSSPNLRAITDICQKMVSSLLMLRNDC